MQRISGIYSDMTFRAVCLHLMHQMLLDSIVHCVEYGK